jgi:DmsE family decaheme c-type cytochrome
MGRRIRAISLKTWLICGLFLWIVALVGVRASGSPGRLDTSPPAEKSAPVQNPPQAAPPAGAGYVGEDTCVTCHEAQGKGRYESSAHAAKVDPRSPAAKLGCESCHGPGAKHVEDPVKVKTKNLKSGVKPNGDPAVINETCTSCHNKQNHVLWDGSQHETRGLSCTTCHSVHSPKSEDKQLKEVTQRELCATCHRDKIAKLDRSGHMPVREQKMECSSCHNVHGTTNVRLLRKGDSVAELCTSCHAEKRGPYLWEHAPSRDGCVTCHDPHGSSNERMLVAKPPLLCQRCHVATRHPATIYDQQAIGSATSPSVRIYARSCVTCHSAIHGSNHPSGQRFVR